MVKYIHELLIVMAKNNEKDFLFWNQPKPILEKDVERQISKKKASKSLNFESDLDLDIFVPVNKNPQINFNLDESKVKIKMTIFKLGQHIFPPNIKSKGIPSLGKNLKLSMEPLTSEPSIPSHLDLQPNISELPNDLRAPQFTKSYFSKSDKMGNPGTTVFPPENRAVYSDTSYPWSTIGRVDTPVGQATGVMVGPRHLLTVSHTIQWNADGTTGWVQFRPGYFAPSTPFGEAWAITTYFKVKVVGPTIDSYEEQFDYVVVVLDRNIGNFTGWMGSKSYTDTWDGNAYWFHAGYPGDLTAGNKPTYEGNIALDGDNSQNDAHEIMRHRGDVWPGQSGGPYAGWWPDNFPYVVSVQSWQNSSYNGASGGVDLVDLIIRARTDFP